MKLLYTNDQPGVHAPSWYHDTCPTTQRPRLEHNLDTDVCIIGAGFTGLAAALELGKQGIDCIVLEAHRVGWGASGRNGGQLGTGFNMDQQSLESLVGKPDAHALWDIAEQAKQWILDTCQKHNADIEYTPGIVSAMHRKRFVQPLHEYCRYLQEHYDYAAIQTLDKQSLADRINSDNYHGGAIDHGAGHIHPLKLSCALARAAESYGVAVLERSEALRIHTRPGTVSQRVVTACGSVSCRRVILATNGYVDTLDGQLNTRLMPINNFIAVTEPLGELATRLLPHDDAVADSRFVVNYYRRVQNDRLLFGGGENYSYRFPESIDAIVRKAMLGVFPQLSDVTLDYAWGGTLAITRNRLPYLNEIRPQRFAAGGYSGHGVALACIYGKALADHLAGDSQHYDVLSQLPNRSFPGGVHSRPPLLAIAMSGYSLLDRF